MSKQRGLPMLTLIYFSIFAGALAVTVGIGMVSYGLLAASARTESRREKTVLDERIATAREIREILSRPQPPIEPLPPITAKLANPVPTKVVGMDTKQTPRRLPKEAMDAFAMGDGYAGPSRGSYQKYDRGGIGGW
jgi:hypothetical protein